MAKSTKDAGSESGYVEPAEYADVPSAPEVWQGAPGVEVERRKANWADLARLPGIGEILTDARRDIDERGPIDGWTVMEETLQRIATAETADDILDDTEAVGAEEMLGKPFTINRVRWADTELRDGFPVFLVMFVTEETHRVDGIVTTSAADIVAKVHALWKRGKLPTTVEVYQTDETKAGYRALKLGRPGRRR
jgi:hypothetical protein